MTAVGLRCRGRLCLHRGENNDLNSDKSMILDPIAKHHWISTITFDTIRKSSFEFIFRIGIVLHCSRMWKILCFFFKRYQEWSFVLQKFRVLWESIELFFFKRRKVYNFVRNNNMIFSGTSKIKFCLTYLFHYSIFSYFK